MRSGQRQVVAVVLALLAASNSAAEEGAVSSHLGGGLAVTMPARGGSADVGGSLLLMSTYGISDYWRIEAPLSFEDVAGRRGVNLGLGLEREFGSDPHLRALIGLGLSSQYSWRPERELVGGVYGAVGARWLFAWGTGLSLEVRAGTLGPLGQAPEHIAITPVLTLYSEL